MLAEADFQKKLIKKLHYMFPDCFILKNDPAETQGLPDLIILNNDRWAALEVKVSSTASIQPNQAFYIETFNKMSFAAFINPENEQDVLDQLEQALQ